MLQRRKLTPTAVSFVLLPVLACGGSGKPTRSQPQTVPSSDSATNVTMKSAAAPNRNASADLGHDGAETWNKPVDDCELPQCIGDAPEALVAAVRERAITSQVCYEQAFRSTPNIAGRLVFLLRITHEGKACPLRVVTNELAESDSLVPCVRSKMEQGPYPRALQGCVDLQVPLRFVPEFIENDAGTPKPDKK